MIIMRHESKVLPDKTCPACGVTGQLIWVAVDPDDENVKDALVCDCGNCGKRVSLLDTNRP